VSIGPDGPAPDPPPPEATSLWGAVVATLGWMWDTIVSIAIPAAMAPRPKGRERPGARPSDVDSP
jgi:hypothetical protein